MGKKLTNEEYVERLQKINPLIVPKEKYQGFDTNIDHECLLCGNVWSLRPNNALHGYGCPRCSYSAMGKRKRKTNDQYIKELSEINPTIKPLEPYQTNKTKILHQCLICGDIFKISPDHTLNGEGCHKCAIKQKGIRHRKSHDQFVSEAHDVNPTLKILDKYQTAKDPIKTECLICGYVWKPYPDNILHGCGCPNCKNKKTSIRCKKNGEKYIDELKDICQYLCPAENYINANTPIQHHCILLNIDFQNAPSTILFFGCTHCKSGFSGENEIKRILDVYNIRYTFQKKFKDLIGIGGGLLSYDFYLPKYNKLIEYQGMQHELPVDYFGGEEKFKIQQEHDRRKREYAKKNNMNLLEIWYYDFDNIEKILIDNLNILSVETAGHV